MMKKGLTIGVYILLSIITVVLLLLDAKIYLILIIVFGVLYGVLELVKAYKSDKSDKEE